MNGLDRIRLLSLRDKVMSAEKAIELIQDGSVVGLSGFGGAGEAKTVPLALADHAVSHPLRITLATGASLGNSIDGRLNAAHAIERRYPYQADPGLRKAINAGEVMYIDQHLSEMADNIRHHNLPRINVAVIAATAITEDGQIIPTGSCGNSANFIEMADHVIIEIDNTINPVLEGVHDIYVPKARPNRGPIPLTQVGERIGTIGINVSPDKISAIVLNDLPDTQFKMDEPDAETLAIAQHLIDFFEGEVAAGRLPENLGPLQSGVGSIANAVFAGFEHSNFHDLEMYSEVLQDCTFQLIDSGKMKFASGCSMTLSEPCAQRVMNNFDQYKDKIVLRPQELSNNPEIIRRLGIIAINTALEFDIYGNVNSTHVTGTKMMNGIGGSGDFTRHAHIAIFVTKSIAKGGAISSVVPMVSHTDHTDHDVDIVVTEQGLADLRGLSPRERARKVIEICAHPDYRAALLSYFERACERGGQTPHILKEALSWHATFEETGSMRQIV
ncbi:MULTISPECIES: succinate CoA transferase [unclassified Acinetobacter]|uniref:succinate CoA transferase n=1 Tax=unclassified Acinetobacter TaxID=196816 RepID=UPI0015D18378|nr:MULTISPECIES: succinate CoA transferase [unclassified Acinetobacter]UUS59019.1 succinate CoA transferase [Acinetobacter sp. YH16040_T]UUS62165.1 succinate CoA transferase [Acinetobacter sp. YH16056_T]